MVESEIGFTGSRDETLWNPRFGLPEECSNVLLDLSLLERAFRQVLNKLPGLITGHALEAVTRAGMLNPKALAATCLLQGYTNQLPST